MSKFDSKVVNKAKNQRGRGPLQTKDRVLSYEGNIQFGLDLKTELFTLAVVNMVSENTFYESAKTRDSRFEMLIHATVQQDPAWVRGFVPFLRNEMNMRSAAVVLACEYVAAGGENGRSVVRSAISRADEPAEVLAYWKVKYGDNIPQPVKRGVADAARDIYNEYNVLKYDGNSRNFRVADVINLTHPKPKDQVQKELFKYALDRRYQGADAEPGESLNMIRLNRAVNGMPKAERRRWLTAGAGEQNLREAGFTWEQLSGWLPDGMDKDAWETIIPSMGYMALLRNLRNFEQAKVSESTMKWVRKVLADPDQVRKSRQLPFRFYSAYVNTTNLKTQAALEDALEVSLENIPELDGETLVLVDGSGSMTWGSLSSNSDRTPAEIAALFGVALGKKNDGDVVVFASENKKVKIDPGGSVLSQMKKVMGANVGAATYLNEAARRHFDKSRHKRVIALTDMQLQPQRSFPEEVPSVYVVDLTGYGNSSINTSKPGRHMIGGFSDKLFSMIKYLEAGEKQNWPWE